MEKRPSTQKGLDLKEIKQMEYLSKVYIILFVNYLFSFVIWKKKSFDMIYIISYVMLGY